MSGFPVVDQGKLVGVVSRSDVVRRICSERDVAERTSDFFFDETGFYEAPMDSFNDSADRVGEHGCHRGQHIECVLLAHGETLRNTTGGDKLAKLRVGVIRRRA